MTTVTANNEKTKQVISTMGFALMDIEILFEDDFENYSNFTLNFPPWIQIDGDGAESKNMGTCDFPNEGYIGSKAETKQ